MSASIDSLLQHPGIWRGDRLSQTELDTIPTGFAGLDAELPGGGWPRGALTEILLEREGIGELRLLLPTLARMSGQGGWLAWVAPPHVPYAPALATAGISLEHLLVAQAQSASDSWWAAEQALRSGSCSTVLAWLESPDERRMRRLQLAAETGNALGILFRSTQAEQERSPAALRLKLEAVNNGLAVHILKRRGGYLGKPVIIDWQEVASGRQRLPASTQSVAQQAA
jgi:hypothetical protein